MTEMSEVLDGTRKWCVVHGDCLDVLRLLPDKCCVVATDFPYQVGKQIANDDLPWEEYLPWLDARIAECRRVAKRVFSTFATTRVIQFIRETTQPPDYLLHWHKPFLLHDRSLNGSPFIAHGEQILYWGPRSAKEAGKRGYDSFAINALWPRERKILGTEHPTPKPEALYQAALEFWADHGDVKDLIVDPLCGGGTTLVAAVRLGLPCVGIDIDERWVNEARSRLKAEEAWVTLGALKRGQGALFGVGT